MATLSENKIIYEGLDPGAHDKITLQFCPTIHQIHASQAQQTLDPAQEHNEAHPKAR